jgi:hypothetical protein
MRSIHHPAENITLRGLSPLEATLSLSIVLASAVIQGLAKYETDIAILDFGAGPVKAFSILDFAATTVIAVIFWIVLVILIHLLLTVFSRHGRFRDFLLYSGFGYLIIAISNLICYLLSNNLINKILVLNQDITNQAMLLEKINQIPVFQYMYIQSRIAEVLFLLFCTFIITKIYRTSTMMALFASFFPVIILYFFTFAFKSWLI